MYRDPKAGLVAEGELWRRGGPYFPPITVLLSLGHGTPWHQYHSITQLQQIEIEATC